MQLNANFKERVVVHGAKLPWQASPIPGVERRMLDRLGDEVARATSIVRYAPGSAFSPHVHTGGEEFLVLDGVFQDEHGDFPAGSYIRNPPETSHTPGSKSGCVIFVKLWQFDMADRTEVKFDTNKMEFSPDGNRVGVEIMQLFANAHECVCLERWAPDTSVELADPGGMEILLLDGGFAEGLLKVREEFKPQSWLRLPKEYATQAVAGPQTVRGYGSNAVICGTRRSRPVLDYRGLALGFIVFLKPFSLTNFNLRG